MYEIMPKAEITCNGNKGWFNETVLEAMRVRNSKHIKYKSTMQPKVWKGYKYSRNTVVDILSNEK